MQQQDSCGFFLDGRCVFFSGYLYSRTMLAKVVGRVPLFPVMMMTWTSLDVSGHACTQTKDTSLDYPF